MQTAVVPIHPIPLTVGNVQTAYSETDVFGDAQTVLPVNVRIFPYEAPLALDQVLNLPFGLKYALPVNKSTALALVAQRASDDHLDSSQYAVGVFIDGTAGLGGVTPGNRVLYGSAPPISLVRDDRPLTSAMHEIGHGLGLVHASNECGGGQDGDDDDNVKDASGNDVLVNGVPVNNKQVGEPWPKDETGQIQGVGLDRRNWNIFATGSLPRPVIAGYPAASQYFDFMSYCLATDSAAQLEADHWISVRNWERLIDFHAPAQALPAAAHPSARAASGTPLRVIATVDAAGRATIVDVAPGQEAGTPPTPGSPYRIELRAATGATLASVVPATSTVADGGLPATLLEATLPLTSSTADVVVSSGGVELAHRLRSMHAPTAKDPQPGDQGARR